MCKAFCIIPYRLSLSFRSVYSEVSFEKQLKIFLDVHLVSLVSICHIWVLCVELRGENESNPFWNKAVTR